MRDTEIIQSLYDTVKARHQRMIDDGDNRVLGAFRAAPGKEAWYAIVRTTNWYGGKRKHTYFAIAHYINHDTSIRWSYKAAEVDSPRWHHYMPDKLQFTCPQTATNVLRCSLRATYER